MHKIVFLSHPIWDIMNNISALFKVLTQINFVAELNRENVALFVKSELEFMSHRLGEELRGNVCDSSLSH